MNRHTKLVDLFLVGLLIAFTACSGGDAPAISAPPVIPSAAPTNSPYITVTPGSTLTATVRASPEPTSTAEIEPQQAAPPHFAAGEALPLTGIHMVTLDEGWALSGSYVFTTADGGRSWLEVTPPEPAPERDDMELKAYAGFLDAQTAWVIYTHLDYDAFLPLGARVWRTSDGGRTWRASAPINHRLYEHSGPFNTRALFTSSGLQNGWLIIQGSYAAAGLKTPSQIFRTVDGGATWQEAALIWLSSDGGETPSIQPMRLDLTGIHFTDPINGWLIWQTAGAYYQDPPSYATTTDGGMSWQSHALPPPADRPGLVQEYIYCETTQLEQPEADSIHLKMDCYEGDSPDISYLYTSDDGGDTWQTYPLPVSRSQVWPYQLRFFDGDNGLLLGGTIYRTGDVGKSWQRVRILAWERAQFSFVDPMNGWAIACIGQGCALVRTTDGGKRWTELKPAAARPLALDHIFMMTPEIGWTQSFLESGKPVRRTMDGGRTWRDVTPQLQGYEIHRLVVLNANTAWLVIRKQTGQSYHLARTTDGGGSWIVLDGGPSFFQGDVTIQFVNRQHGLMVSGAPAAGKGIYNIYETYDGGTTWGRMPINLPGQDERPGTLVVCNICGDRVFVDGMRVIVARGSMANTPDGAVHLEITTDLGRSWARLELPYPPGLPAEAEVDPRYNLAFFGPNGYLPVVFQQGFENRRLGIYVTGDGGATWQVRPDVFPLPASLAFTSAQDGFLVWQGALYATHDAAASWQVSNPDLNAAFQGDELELMDFVSATAGWAVTSRPEESGPAVWETWWRTTDGGLTWTVLDPLLVP